MTDICNEQNELDKNIISIIEREFMEKILETILLKLKKEVKDRERLEFINYIDNYGYSLAHYFAYIDYHQALKILAANGADMNIRSSIDDSYPLYIASA